MFYEFRQNNSGGRFDVDDKLCHRVFIEADTAEEANAKLLELGGYFDGCSTGRDCDCCGDRWEEQSGEGNKYPFEYIEGVTFKDVKEHAQYLANNYGWTVPDVRIYYKDGTVEDVKTIQGGRNGAGFVRGES